MGYKVAKTTADFRHYDYQSVHKKLLARQEIALLDVREEGIHAQGHPLFAANFPLSQIELNGFSRLPRRDVPICTFDSGEGLAATAARRFRQLGYSDVGIFTGGLEQWKSSGGEVFIDVNVPSKAFGELLESVCHTPSLSAQEVKAMLEDQQDMIIVDVRRFDEYQSMCIPGAVNIPGAELVLKIADLAPNSQTRIIVNCAGRTRSLIGTQSLRNAGLANPLAALRNGTIGWMLADQQLEYAQSRRHSKNSAGSVSLAKKRARAVADRSGVKRTSLEMVTEWLTRQNRTTYLFDVRSAEEYCKGHINNSVPVAGGQLVQETEMYAPVHGARIVLIDNDAVRANMSASWLAQMGWDVYVVDNLCAEDFSESGKWQAGLPALPNPPLVTPQTLQQWIATQDSVVIDLAKYVDYQNGHIPGAWYVIRSDLQTALSHLPVGQRYILTSTDDKLARFAFKEFYESVKADVFVLAGGTQAWVQAGFEIDSAEKLLASKPVDRYQRPYEGINASPEAMQAYLDWEFGLIEQLQRDGTHHFQPLI